MRGPGAPNSSRLGPAPSQRMTVRVPSGRSPRKRTAGEPRTRERDAAPPSPSMPIGKSRERAKEVDRLEGVAATCEQASVPTQGERAEWREPVSMTARARRDPRELQIDPPARWDCRRRPKDLEASVSKGPATEPSGARPKARSRLPEAEGSNAARLRDGTANLTFRAAACQGRRGRAISERRARRAPRERLRRPRLAFRRATPAPRCERVHAAGGHPAVARSARTRGRCRNRS